MHDFALPWGGAGSGTVLGTGPLLLGFRGRFAVTWGYFELSQHALIQVLLDLGVRCCKLIKNGGLAQWVPAPQPLSDPILESNNLVLGTRALDLLNQFQDVLELASSVAAKATAVLRDLTLTLQTRKGIGGLETSRFLGLASYPHRRTVFFGHSGGYDLEIVKVHYSDRHSIHSLNGGTAIGSRLLYTRDYGKAVSSLGIVNRGCR